MYRKLISFVLPALFITLQFAAFMQNIDQQEVIDIELLQDENGGVAQRLMSAILPDCTGCTKRSPVYGSRIS